MAGVPAILHAARTAGDKPNLLFLWTDEQRADTLAAYGNKRFRVPVLNRLAAESVVFGRCYVTQPVCTPSRASVMTGLWPHQTGCVRNNIALKREIRTLPELVSDAAYRSGYIGKWHLGDEVFAQRGFATWVSMEDGYQEYYSPGRDHNTRSSYHHFLVERGYKPSDRSGAFSRDFAVRLPVEHCKPAFLASEATRFILGNKHEPWMLYVNFLEPHMPFHGPYNDLHSDQEAPVPPNYPGDTVAREPVRYGRSRRRLLEKGFDGHDLRSRPGWQRLNRNYAGLCAQVDQAVGRILWALEASGQAENTIIVFTSDHGEMMGAHSLIGKGVMYEEAMRIPMLLRVPFRRQKPAFLDRAFSHIDLAPTLLELLGKKDSATLPGRSWVPLLAGAAHDGQPVFCQWNTEGDDTSARTVITQDGWKMAIHDKDNCLLFNRRKDPLELHNLYYERESQATVAELRKSIERWMRTTDDKFSMAT